MSTSTNTSTRIRTRKRPNPQLYSVLSEQLSLLEKTGKIDLDFKAPLTPCELKALSFRLTRRGRGQKVHTLHITSFQFQQPQESDGANGAQPRDLDIIEGMIQRMPNVQHLLIGVLNNARDTLELESLTETARLLHMSRFRMPHLVQLSLSHWPRLLTDNNDREKQAWALQTLIVGHVGQQTMPAFVHTLSEMPQLTRLAVGLGNGSTDQDCRLLLEYIGQKDKHNRLKVVHLWAPLRETESKLSSGSLKLLANILRKGQLRALLLEHLPGLFSSSSSSSSSSSPSHALQEFLSALCDNRTLQYLSLDNGMNLSEHVLIRIFQTLQSNHQGIKTLKIQDMRMSMEGWESIFDSLARNTTLTHLTLECTFTRNQGLLSTQLSQKLINELRRNVSITAFSVKVHSKFGTFSMDSDNHEMLSAIAWRNKALKRAKRIYSIPASLLPRVLSQNNAGEGHSAVFSLVRNSASLLLGRQANLSPTNSPTLYGKRKRMPPCPNTHVFENKQMSRRLETPTATTGWK